MKNRLYLTLNDDILNKLAKKAKSLGIKPVAYVRMMIFKEFNKN